MAAKSPTWLDAVARKHFNDTLTDHPNIDRTLLALLSDAYSTWRSSTDELGEYVKQHGSMVITTNGKPAPHPSFLIQERSHNKYVKLAKLLNLLGNTTKEAEDDPLADVGGL
jgi:phage terminase small subunit